MRFLLTAFVVLFVAGGLSGQEKKEKPTASMSCPTGTPGKPAAVPSPSFQACGAPDANTTLVYGWLMATSGGPPLPGRTTQVTPIWIVKFANVTLNNSYMLNIELDSPTGKTIYQQDVQAVTGATDCTCTFGGKNGRPNPKKPKGASPIHRPRRVNITLDVSSVQQNNNLLTVTGQFDAAANARWVHGILSNEVRPNPSAGTELSLLAGTTTTQANPTQNSFTIQFDVTNKTEFFNKNCKLLVRAYANPEDAMDEMIVPINPPRAATPLPNVEPKVAPRSVFAPHLGARQLFQHRRWRIKRCNGV